MAIKNVTVYAASSDRVAEVYKQAAFALGVGIARRGWRQINGGGSTGLMRAATDGCLSVGGEIRVVILDHFRDMGYLHPKVKDVVAEDSMPGRKRGLYELGDAYIGLPGGLGTFEEIMEVLSWRQLGFHEKAIGLVNVQGFYDPLLKLVDDSTELGFVAPRIRTTFCATDAIEELLDWLDAYEPEAFSIDSKV